MDITFSQNIKDVAISTMSVLTYPHMKLVYQRSRVDHITLNYIPGFLAFREAPSMVKLFEDSLVDFEMKAKNISLVLIDGNGELHPRECGLACHFGVLIDLPTVGCAKTIFDLDGINKSDIKKIKKEFKMKGEVKGIAKPLIGKSKRVWGMALKATEKSYDPLIVTRGHKVGLDSAIKIVTKCCQYRVPQPIRAADKESRKLIIDFEKKYTQRLKNGEDLKMIITEYQEILAKKHFMNEL
jgi:deoxyinosine 3'endonuclease (endonuclease V)